MLNIVCFCLEFKFEFFSSGVTGSFAAGGFFDCINSIKAFQLTQGIKLQKKKKKKKKKKREESIG